MTMLEMSKTILQRVSFDPNLFQKELTKALKWLRYDEKLLLKVWCLSTFGHVYKELILDAFRTLTKT
jgi:hypothetical protein